MDTRPLKLKLPEYDTAFQKSSRKGYYQRSPLFQAMSICIKWGTAVDVGAHVGFMSRDMAKFFDRVHAFEPQPDNFQCLCQNIPDGVMPYNVALGDSYREVGLRTPRIANSGAWEVCEGSDVHMTPLDSYNLTDVGLIKIDAQGAEVDVLRGAKETLLREQPVILAECMQNKEINPEPIKFLKSLGAIPMFRVKDDFIFAWPKYNNVDTERLHD